jgi:hypothetical protein
VTWLQAFGCMLGFLTCFTYQPGTSIADKHGRGRWDSNLYLAPNWLVRSRIVCKCSILVSLTGEVSRTSVLHRCLTCLCVPSHRFLCLVPRFAVDLRLFGSIDSPIPDAFSSLKEFTSEEVVASVAACVNVISNGESNFPLKLPANVAVRHRTCTLLANTVKVRV